MKRLTRLTILMTGVATLGAFGAAHAGDEGVYNLGQIHVTAPSDTQQQEFDSFGGSTISNAQTTRYNTSTLDKAIDLAPGVNFSSSGGQRNESNIYVHGFDRWQVPLSVDGVRIYLPYDNRLDFARFLTYDASQIQIAKGYVSVLDGPGALGGAINIVTKKPTKEREGEWRTEADFGNNGSYDGIKTYGRVGTNQKDYYLQVSGAWQNMNGWELPASFASTSKFEDGNRRNFSYSKDWGINVKAGWTPNADDEYSINYIRQEGDKGAPYNVYSTADTNGSKYKWWSWPMWNVQTLSTATKTRIGDDSYIKSRVFWETFDNAINFWDNTAQTLQYTSSAGYSVYNDWAVGTAIEGGHDFGDRDTLKLATHIRRDSHSSWSNYFTDQYGANAGSPPPVGKGTTSCPDSAGNPNTVCFTSPSATAVEDTYSLATENTLHVNRDFDLVQGISYDRRHLRQADDYVLGGYDKNAGNLQYQPYWVHYPLTDASAFNWQGAAIWRYSETAKLFANVSDRTRFPTLFERFSNKFGTAVSNPGLQPERAVNYQIGWTNNFAPRSQVSVLVYYATVKSMIQSVNVSGSYVTPGGATTSYYGSQSQNVGDGYRYGADLSVDYALKPTVMMGGNISYIHNEITNPADPTYLPTGIPTVKGMAYATWQPFDGLTLTPNVQVANNRWSTSTSYSCGASNKYSCYNYVGTGAYVLGNFAAEYKVRPEFIVSAGVKNIFDKLYELSWGYPEAGRTYYVAMRGTF